MNKEKTKVKKISNQIMDVFFANDINNIKIDLSILNGESLINICGDIENSNIDIKELKDNLIGARALEYDDYYDELIGIGEVEAIKYVSYLSNSVDVKVEDNILYIEILRKHF